MEPSEPAPGGYRRRIVDDELDLLLPEFPALVLDGPKGVGKTATASERALTSFRLDSGPVRSLVEADPERLVRPIDLTLIDEWQRFPPSWDVVRRAVDADPRPGRFLLTGSASPASPPTHSGAGRIVSVRMRPLSLCERAFDTPSVSLQALLAGESVRLEGATSRRLEDYVAQIVRGGFPGMVATTPRAVRGWLGSYVGHIVDRDFPEAGLSPRNPALLHRWLSAYAAATSTTASFESIRDAASAGYSQKPAKSTTIPYVDTLTRIWVADPVPGWLPTNSPLNRMTAAPKHHLADPALAVSLVGLTADDLLAGAPGRGGHVTFLGALFESLVTQSLRVYAQACEATVAHLRTRAGEREVDLLVLAPGGRVLACEVKLSATVDDADVRHLLWLRDKLGPRLVDSLVITTGSDAYRRADGVGVVPAALLGP